MRKTPVEARWCAGCIRRSGDGAGKANDLEEDGIALILFREIRVRVGSGRVYAVYRGMYSLMKIREIPWVVIKSVC